MRFDNLVHTMRSTVWIPFRTIDQIMKASNGLAANLVRIGTCDDPAAMVGAIA
jgi:hypothetical protein